MRHEITVTVSPDKGERFKRDFGKSYHIIEMDAAKGEEWAARALFAMGKANVDIPPEMIMLGWQAVVFAGLRALLAAPWEDAKPLLDDMMNCVQFHEPLANRMIMDGDIEEIATRVWLRDEVFKLHANFSVIDAVSTIQSRLDSSPPTVPTRSNTRTSRRAAD